MTRARTFRLAAGFALAALGAATAHADEVQLVLAQPQGGEALKMGDELIISWAALGLDKWVLPRGTRLKVDYCFVAAGSGICEGWVQRESLEGFDARARVLRHTLRMLDSGVDENVFVSGTYRLRIRLFTEPITLRCPRDAKCGSGDLTVASIDSQPFTLTNPENPGGRPCVYAPEQRTFAHGVRYTQCREGGEVLFSSERHNSLSCPTPATRTFMCRDGTWKFMGEFPPPRSP